MRALNQAGANIALLTHRSDPPADLAARIGVSETSAEVIFGDALNRDSLRSAAEAVARRFGVMHGLINAAGGNKPGATTAQDLPFFDLPEDALRCVVDLNLLGTLVPCQGLGRMMAERREGVILNFSSMNAYRPLTRTPAYSAAKSAVSSFTQWLAVLMAQTYSPRIRVNAIAPGFFLTEQNRYLLTDRDSDELTPRGRAILQHTPMARFGLPEDILGSVFWLLSPSSAFVAGITEPVDRGFSALSGV